MRVTDSARLTATTAGLAKASERLLEFQRQVSTGKRISRPSDDPSAVTTTILERGSQASVERYLQQADSARARLTVTDTVLSDLIQQLESSQVAILSARGTIRTPQQREAAAQTLEQLRDSVLRDLNTSYRGGYIFGGARGTTPPYQKDNAGVVSAYQGSTVEVSVDVNTQHEVAVVFNGEAVAKGADVDDIFVVFDRAIAAVRAGDEAGINSALDGVKRAVDRVTALQSRVGASLRAIEEDVLTLEETNRASTARVSALEDANMAAAISGMTQAETTYRAALGVAAQLNRLSLMDYLK